VKLTYDHYSNFHARKCSICKGAKRVNREGVWVTCGCQFNATAKWRLDQIQIYPETLKFKSWDDFVGINASGKKLTDSSFVEAKAKALKYCFGQPDPTLAKDRNKNSVILEHIRDGQNVVVAGGAGSGRSLVAALILKEVFYASAIKQHKTSFHWVRAAELTEAARWATTKIGDVAKAIDRDRLDEWAECDFLFVDGVDLKPSVGDHRAPPDMTSLNILFSKRFYKPTVVVCTDRFLKACNTPGPADLVREQWGEDFFTLMRDPGNVVIELEKEAAKVV
jgi:hypothetical protein